LAFLHAQRLHAVCRGTPHAALRRLQRGRRLCRARSIWQAGGSGPGYAAGRRRRAVPGGESRPRRPHEALLPRRWDGQEAPRRSGYAANSVLLLLLTTMARSRGRVGPIMSLSAALFAVSCPGRICMCGCHRSPLLCCSAGTAAGQHISTLCCYTGHCFCSSVR